MIKKILIVISAAVLVLFAYANLRFVNPSAHLEPVDLKTIDIKNPGAVDISNLEKHVMADPAVRAFSLDETAGVAGVTYQYQKLSKEELLQLVSMDGKLEVSERFFAETGKPGCPVHGVLAMWEKTLSVLRIVQ